MRQRVLLKEEIESNNSVAWAHNLSRYLDCETTWYTKVLDALCRLKPEMRRNSRKVYSIQKWVKKRL